MISGRTGYSATHTRLYSRVWVALYPVRPLIMFVHKGCGWIRRHIFKRGERS